MAEDDYEYEETLILQMVMDGNNGTESATVKPMKPCSYINGSYKQITLSAVVHSISTFEPSLSALCSSALLVIGIFSNMIAISVFDAPVFNWMSFRVYMKILCVFNIIGLICGMIRQHSFSLDFRPDIDPEARRYACTYILWFIHVAEHTLVWSIALIILNRIKAQRQADNFSKSLEALRWPVLANTSIFLLCMVPVSTYITELNLMTLKFNRTECAFAYLRPHWHHGGKTSIVMGGLPLVEELTIFCMTIVLLIEMGLKSRRNRKLQQRLNLSDESVDIIAPAAQLELLWQNPGPQPGRHSRMSYRHRCSYKGAADENVEFPSYQQSNGDWDTDVDDTREMDLSVMTVVVVILFLISSLPKKLVHTPIIIANVHYVKGLAKSFATLLVFDAVFYTYLAAMFLIFCAGSPLYRKEAYKILFEVPFIETDTEELIKPVMIETLDHAGKSKSVRKLTGISIPRRDSRRGSTTSSAYPVEAPNRCNILKEEFNFSRDMLTLIPSAYNIGTTNEGVSPDLGSGGIFRRSQPTSSGREEPSDTRPTSAFKSE